MHERFADYFENTLVAIIALLAIVIVLGTLGMAAATGVGSAVAFLLISGVLVVLSFGIASVLISIRHKLGSINEELRRQNGPAE